MNTSGDTKSPGHSSSYFIKKYLTFIICLAAIGFASTASAIDYGAGTGGIKTASYPPPGFYYLMYNMYYTADKMMDDNGDESMIEPDAHVFANAHRFATITKHKIFGAYYGNNFIFSVVNQDIEMKAGDMTVAETNVGQLGDFNIEALILTWHGPTWDTTFSVNFVIPSGNYDKNAAINISKDHYSVLFSLGGTKFPTIERNWSFSAFTRTEVHAQNEHDDITDGVDFLVEGGIGRRVKNVEFGVSGYGRWQLTEDTGTGSTSEKERQYALGPEIQITIPKWKFLVTTKYYKQFGSRNTTEGDQFWLNFMKSF